MSFCTVVCAGRLTRDPREVQTRTGTQMVSFSIAINTDKDNAMFIDCNAYGKVASNILQYFKKGKPIRINGDLKEDTYNGHKKLQVNVLGFGFYDMNKDGDQSAQDDSGDDYNGQTIHDAHQQPKFEY